jgi:pyruvate,orthophosphate dikinase
MKFLESLILLSYRLGLPVPPGFIITSETTKDFQTSGNAMPENFQSDYVTYIRNIERRTGKVFGGAPTNTFPLLLSARCGSKRTAFIDGYAVIYNELL